MQVRSTEIRSIACFVCVAIFLLLETVPFLSSTFLTRSIYSPGIADAAAIPSNERRARAATREGVGTQREIELVHSTSQGVTIQLLIPESDFEMGTEKNSLEQLRSNSQVLHVESQAISFPGCRFTAQPPGVLRLPVQSTLIGVPTDVDFQVRIVEKDFSTRKMQKVVSVSTLQGATQSNASLETDRFFPTNLVETKDAGWIRENRVLPIQLNPVQYNPVRREVRLYHRLVVEVRFIQSGNALSTPRGPLTPESSVYNTIFENLLVNPQDVRQWRAATFRMPQAPSIPSTSPHYKLSVTEDGMYSVTGQDLEAAGVNIDAIAPRTLTLTNRGKQVPIFVRGENDGRLNPVDEIVFYGEQLHGDTSYINPFSDENVYWLTWNAGPGSRMGTRTSLDGTDVVETHEHFLTRVHFEKDNHYRRFPDANLAENQVYQEFSPGLQERSFAVAELPPLPNDSWFWAQLAAPTSKAFGVTLAGVADTALSATIRVGFYGRSKTEHQADVWLNDEVSLGAAHWNGETEYQLQNQRPQFFLKDGRNVIRVINPESTQGLLDIILLNWIQIDYRRNFHAKADVLPFAITPLPDETGTVNPNFEVVLKNFSTPDIEIYGIDGTRYVGLGPIVDERLPGTYRLPFRSTQIRPKGVDDTAIQYIALTRNRLRKPKISVDTPSDLRSTHNAADYIIITHQNFLEDVQPLADFRSQQGLRTKVVDVQNIYDEFNHGILNPNAIREFLSYAYHNWQLPAPTYVFLVGDTHVDLKNQISFVPTIQVQIPGYGTSASDHQFVTFRGTDSFPDMLIGRMPANNRIDVRIFVERTINYETTSPIGPWHKRLLMLAGSDLRFHSQTNRLISRNQLSGKYETERIYAPHTDEPNFDERIRSPIARRVIDSFNNGATVVNYIGHGGGGIWGSSRMLDFEDPEQNLTNISQLPLVISMTCYTGSFDSSKNSLAEELLRSENGGAIAVIGATSIGLLQGDYLLNLEIFDVIFNQYTLDMGAILAEAKTQFLINAPGFLDLAEVFTLFGDPATRLKLPSRQMQVTVEVGGSHTQETLLTVSGTLPDRTFSGNAEITVIPTIEEIAEDIPSKQENVAVVNGQFTAEIQIPTDAEFNVGDVQVYAWNADEDLIGHTSYNVLSRYVDNVRIAPYPVEPHQPVYLYTEVLDESAIDELNLFWSWDGYEFFAIPVSRRTGTTYRSEQPIPGYPEGDLIDYYLEVKLQDGHTLQTEKVTYEFGHVAFEIDLVLLNQTITWSATPPFMLSAQIRNAGSKPAHNVPVRFFLKALSPETDTANANTTSVPTLEELQNATPIGDVQVLSEVLPGSQVVASVPWEPSPGEYLITVYVDPPSAGLPQGNILEQREKNNSASREFTGNRFILTPETVKQPIQSPDGTFQVAVSPTNLQTSTVLTYSEETLTITNQPDVTVVSESMPQVAYQLNLSEQTELVASVTFLKNVSKDAHIYRRDDDNGNWIRVGNETVGEETLSAEVRLPGTFALLSNSDSSPPALDLTFEHQGFVDGDYISDTPVISVRIEDANGIDSRPEHIILTKNGQRVPEDEYIIAASPTNNNLLLVTYNPVLEPGEYRIRLQAQDANGNTSDTERAATVAGEFEIANIANFPNPFTPGRGTHFAYYLTESADEVSLKIYTITGRRIAAIDTLDASVSYNEFHYDGYDADGAPLGNGVYLYKFTARKGDIRKQKVGKIAVRK